MVTWPFWPRFDSLLKNRGEGRRQIGRIHNGGSLMRWGWGDSVGFVRLWTDRSTRCLRFVSSRLYFLPLRTLNGHVSLMVKWSKRTMTPLPVLPYYPSLSSSFCFLFLLYIYIYLYLLIIYLSSACPLGTSVPPNVSLSRLKKVEMLNFLWILMCQEFMPQNSSRVSTVLNKAASSGPL